MTRHDPSVSSYTQDLTSFPSLTETQIRELWKQYKKRGDKKAKHRLIEGNLKLVLPLARRYTRSGMDLFDLIEEGNLGLIEAIERYNPKKSFHFASYANFWIERYIRKTIETQSKAIRIPQHIWEELRTWLKKWEELNRSFGRHPTMDEMKNTLHLSSKKIRQIIEAIEVSHAVTSLETPIDEDGELTVKDVLTDKTSELPEKTFGIAKSNEELAQALKQIGARERKILEMRFGLNPKNKKYTLEEIASKFKNEKGKPISRERVRQLEKRAMHQLRWVTKKMEMA
jgi:RNA polymerase primary sigma factor